MASIEYNLDQGQARAFLNALAHNNDFRESLQANPQQALADHGIIVDDDAIPTGGDLVVELPPRHLAAWALDHLLDPKTYPYPSPAISETNPWMFSSCTIWGITLAVAARAK